MDIQKVMFYIDQLSLVSEDALLYVQKSARFTETKYAAAMLLIAMCEE